ncbi:MAG: DUF748 domain-containing protein [Nitrospiraceae bacterium]|nr:DUF748 domain-containing protein [Nitrospiraceae bacterium]
MEITGRVKRLGRSRAAKKAFAGVLIFLLVFSVTGFFIAPPVIKSVLTSKLSKALHRQVIIREVRVNPFALSVTVRGFRAMGKDGKLTFAYFDELYLNLQSISILKRGLVFSAIKLKSPYLNIVRNEDKSYNFSDLLGQPKASGPKKPAPRFSFNNIQIINGSVDFFDGPEHKAHTVRNININVPFISSLPYYTNIYVQPSFDATVNGTHISIKGKTKPFEKSLQTYFHINVKGLNIPYYLAYSPVKLPFVLQSGLLDVNADISYVQYRDRAPSIDLSGDAGFRNIRIDSPSLAPVFSLPALDLSFAPSDLMAKQIHLLNVTAQSPELNVTRDRAGRISLLSLLQSKKGKPAEKAKTAFSLDADHVRVAGGKLAFSDFRAAPFKTTLENINLGIDHLSTAPGRKAKANLSFQTESGEGAKLESEFSLYPFASSGTLALAGIRLKKYAPYYSKDVHFDLKDGALAFSTEYDFKEGGNGPDFSLSGLSATVTSLKLRKRGEKRDFLQIPAVSVNGTSVDFAKRVATIGSVSTGKGVLVVERRGGKMNIQGLISKAGPVRRQARAAKEPVFLVALKNISARDYTVRFNDATPQGPVNVVASRINFRGANISTARNARGRVSLSLVLNKSGVIKTYGSVITNPLSADMRLNARGVGISPLQPYFTDRVKILVTSGEISLNGGLRASLSRGGAIKASYTGSASAGNFNSLDKAKGEEFLKWGSLYFGGIDAAYSPLYVHIKQVALTDFYSRLIINKDGSINVQGIAQTKGGGGNPAPAPKEAGGPAAETYALPEMTAPGALENPPVSTLQNAASAGAAASSAPAQKTGKLIKIDSVTFQGGTINFSDKHIEPNYSSSFLDVGGRISGLSSEENKFADVDLRGKLENYAPLEITGKINPLRDDLYVNLNIDFRNMDLSPLTPYSGRYLGYAISKGALSLNLHYLIVKKKLDAQNHILLDQFTLGNPVESPKATKLPVKLAIALLKNRNGNIRLNVPVSGYLNDPEFSIGRIILRMLVNLMVKIATSPFTILGHLFGGGEELSHVEFDYGSYALAPQDIKKLETIGKALADRPALKLEVEGHVDLARDKEGLMQYMFGNELKVQKLKDMIRHGQQAVPLDKITIGKDEYAKYLTLAYKAAKFPKPRTFLGFTKKLPVPEMEKLMLTHIKVTNDDLRQLASKRALAVKNYIIKSGKVAPDRVFLVEPKSLAPEKKDNLKNSRVDFKLQ